METRRETNQPDAVLRRGEGDAMLVACLAVLAALVTAVLVWLMSPEPATPAAPHHTTLPTTMQSRHPLTDAGIAGEDDAAGRSTSAAAPAGNGQPAAPGEWVSLFDGKTLSGWKITDFGGQGDVTVEDRDLLLGVGNYLTGVTLADSEKLPRIDYEVDLKAMRVDGSDFFCGLTFPVKDDPCTLILGGWGGGLCGLSSLDGLDASENQTGLYREFENGRWYRVRLRVTEPRIQAWLDDELIIDQEITGRKISIRFEVELSQPFGFASYASTAALRDIRLRQLREDEIPAREEGPQ